MSSNLIQQLQQLQRGFSALCTSEADADSVYEGAVAFGREVDSRATISASADLSRWARGCRQAQEVAAAGGGLRSHC